MSLGNDPALTVGDRPDKTPVVRAVSVRWLTGTILTGFTSIFLMGGALMAALDGRHQLAVPPQALTEAERAALDLELGMERKGDRVRHEQVVEVATREIMQVSTLTRQGDHDLIKLRPFAHVTASLVAHKEELSAAVPEFDPVKIFNAGTVESTPADGAVSDQIYTAEVDGEIAVKTVPFPLNFVRAMDRTPAFSVAEVEEMVRYDAGLIDVDVSGIAALDPDLGGFGAEGPAGGDYDALGVRIIPENVTFVSKSDPSGALASLQEKVATVKAKDTLDSLLERYKVGDDDREDVIAAMTRLVDLDTLKEGQKVRVAFAPFDSDGGTLRPVRVSIYSDGVHQATVARTDDNGFVRADEPNALPEIAVAEAEMEELDSGSVPRVYEAVYQTALNQQMPPAMINELIKVLSYEVDFQARVNYGDGVEVLHSLPEGAGQAADETGEILYASITLGGVEKRFYRYRTADDGIVDYYDAEGRSAKKFLMRKPLSAGVFRSGFGMRRHPIVGRTRLHTGVDWAAPRGTPIMAAGDGVVEKAGRSSGYGNFTLIKHTNGYETAYGHQTKFASGIVPGAHVRQGQIIGYVGSTGLSTGPHLHYEVRINGKFVDPLRIRLPRGRILTDRMLANFERERQRIDQLLGNEPDKNRQLAAANN